MSARSPSPDRQISPEADVERESHSTSVHPKSVAAFAVLTIATAGMVLVAVAYDRSRAGQSWATAVFWLGLLLMVVPLAFRLVGKDASRGERLWLLIAVGLELYSVKILLSPSGFTLHDELGSVRSVQDLVRTGRLYTPNPIVDAYSYYPGILSVTAALSEISGLHPFVSGVIVIGIARAMLVGGVYMLAERVLRSPRAACLAVLVYMGNPNFVFFDSQFAYESLAIGFAALALATAAGLDLRATSFRSHFVAGILVATVVLTHHLTSYALALTLVAWAVGAIVLTRSASGNLGLLSLAGFALASTIAYAVYAFAPTSSDIGPSLIGSLKSLYGVISGTSAGKAPFTAAKGYSDPILEQIIGLLGVALLLGALPFGLLAAWRRRPHDIRLVTLAVAAALYPASLAVRLTGAGTETSNRTSEFLFAGLGLVTGLLLLRALPEQDRRRPPRILLVRSAVTLFVALVFSSGILVGTPPYDLTPASHFEVSADLRSIDSEGLAAAQWASRRLPTGAYFLADHNDTSLLTAYTPLVPQTGKVDGLGIGRIFTSRLFTPSVEHLVKFDKLRYLIVDRRDSTALPRIGHYFESSDPASSYSSPISLSALNKFGRVRCMDQVFSSGNIVIYDTHRLLTGCQ